MNQNVFAFRSANMNTIPEIHHDRFDGVEFSVKGLELNYRCKLRSRGLSSTFILIRENSIVLNGLQVGDILNMTCYYPDPTCPTERLDTQIEYITKNEEGPFKGHFLVGLTFLQEQRERKFNAL